MTEFLKGYAAGANDMEAGRLVTKPDGLDFAVAQVRDRDLVIESLREQLEAYKAQLHGERESHQRHVEQHKVEVDMVVASREAAEAKLAEVERILNKSVTSRKATEKRLAEVEKERDKTEEYAKEGWDWLSEALDALGAKTVFDIKARAAAMDRARELAERQVPIARKEAEWTREATWSDAAIAFDQIARLLGGDDEPTTKGDA